MRHRNKRKILKRPTHQRKALYRNLARNLFFYESITTTEGKARAVKPRLEKLMTKAKKGDLHNRRQLIADIQDDKVVEKMITVLGKRYKDRAGGYTRIIKMKPRQGDGAKMAKLELV